ncbi:MAG TPA: type II toxin-antitoxin system VapC family toxin, partial [Geminicoccaceae bacterium]
PDRGRDPGLRRAGPAGVVVIDTSAVLAILFDEPGRRPFNERIEADPERLMSVANYLEAGIIVDDRLGDEGARALGLLIAEAGVEIVPVTLAQAEIARQAYRRFGKGNHPARLNYGDCFAYALARETGEPLLFKGDDFGQTDIARA